MSLDFYLLADTGGAGRPSVFDANITHNLGRMWAAAGCYEALYESKGKLAEDIVPALRDAFVKMAEHPDEYREFDAPNGWGLYENALPWLLRVWQACVAHPKAIIDVSR